MSSTRHAAPGAPLRQERYASSPALGENGLKAALVARRCSVLDDAAQREIIWWLQFRSHLSGCLDAVSNQLCERFPERLASKTLSELRPRPDQKLDTETVRTLRNELSAVDDFLLRGEVSERERIYLKGLSWSECGRVDPEMPETMRTAVAGRPTFYRAAEFFDLCRAQAESKLVDRLTRLCLDPDERFVDECYFQRFEPSLSTLVEEWAQQHQPAARTAVTTAMEQAIDYAIQTRSVVMLCGPNGLGKSWNARSYCQRRPGRARFVQVPSGNDRKTFFEAFAEGFGGPAGDSWKARELQVRVEDILANSGLVPILDDALQLLPDRERDANPDRIDWIVTALADRGLPCVLVTNHSFDVRLAGIEERSRWSGREFRQRVLRYPLPDSLSRADIEAVAASMFPGASEDDFRAVAITTVTSGARSLHFLEQIRRSAEFIAKQSGSANAISTALKTIVNPAAREAAAALLRGKNSKQKNVKPPDLLPNRETRANNPLESRAGVGFSTVAAE